MSITKAELFATPIYQYWVPEAEKVNERLKYKILELVFKDNKGIQRSNKLGWHSRVDLHDDPNFLEITNAILDVAIHVFDDHGYYEFSNPAIVQMWANVHPQYGFHHAHLHPNCLWTGVYYVQVPDGAGDIHFSDPRVQARMVRPRLSSESELGSSGIRYTPAPGMLLFFPSWLVHSVEPNQSETQERISISFDLVQET